MTVWEWAEANKKLWHIVKEELGKGTVDGYRKELLQKYFCIKGYVTSSYILFLNLCTIYNSMQT
jgi:hypothetical protein